MFRSSVDELQCMSVCVQGMRRDTVIHVNHLKQLFPAQLELVCLFGSELSNDPVD